MFGLPFGSPRISTKHLAGLCRRVGMSLEAGIDVRKIWDREARQAPGRRARACLSSVSEAIQQGESLRAALAEAGGFFPPLFREIVEVGDQSGRLGETFAQLADHYEGQLQIRRTFLAALTWPLIELAFTLAVIAVLIWLPSTIAKARGMELDLLGLGLTGNRGLAIYLAFLAAVAGLFFYFLQACRRGLLWTRPVQRLFWRIPGLSGPLRTLSLARLAWSLNLTFNTGMDVRQALRMSLRSTHNARITDHIEAIERAVVAGDSLFEAFQETGAFPPEFLQTLNVGEESGKLVEAMGRLSVQYRSQAEAALKVSSTAGAFAVWAVIALVMVAVIFRVFSSYIGMIQGAMPP